MRILIITPAMWPPHGGLRVINEWANRLAERHEVYLHSLKKRVGDDWCPLSPKVNFCSEYRPAGMDCLIVTSPHSIEYADRRDRPPKVFLFMQMMEHLFRPNDVRWQRLCRRFYTSPYPMINISRWNQRDLQVKYGRHGKMFYVGNGVNLKDFPIDASPKDNRTVLFEGLEAYNPTKDVNKVGLYVAGELARRGYRVLSYGQVPLGLSALQIVREYHCCPSLPQLNNLYREATILVKASKYDARSCAPMEAMTKGTVTARAIIEGDDDLIHDENCLRSAYTGGALLHATNKLLDDVALRMRLANNCLQYVQKHTWDHWIPQIEAILCS